MGTQEDFLNILKFNINHINKEGSLKMKISLQAKELLASIKLKEYLSDKGKSLIWGIDNIKEENNKTIYTFDSQPKLCYKIQVSI